MQPISAAIEPMADHREAWSPPWSSTIRTARSRISGENRVDVFFVMAPSSQRLVNGWGLRQTRGGSETPDAIGWQRGTDRFVVINKAAAPFEIADLRTPLQEGEYREVRTGWPMHVQPGGTIQRWSVPPRTAVMFVRVGS